LDYPDLSFIELADGQLYTDDLLQQNMQYELVVLSACETGRTQIAPGDERIGLGRGFLYVGAATLVASLWRTEDQFTKHLMECFYDKLLAGMSKSSALQYAQITVLSEQSDLHPAYWGAFQLIGDSSPLLV
jgi:CHAT domain-containing protein